MEALAIVVVAVVVVVGFVVTLSSTEPYPSVLILSDHHKNNAHIENKYI